MGQAQRGEIDLAFLDEAGFAPTLPLSYTWCRVGTRAVVPYVAPQGRRVNAGGALCPYGPRRRFAYHSATGKIDRAVFLEFVWEDVAGLPTAPADLPAGYTRARPCVIVLDNYSVHRSAAIKEVVPLLRAAGVSFYYLPPYSPELHAIEVLWRHMKYEELPERSYATAELLKNAVDGVLEGHVKRLAQSTTSLREAA
jgi:hypothetical protein